MIDAGHTIGMQFIQVRRLLFDRFNTLAISQTVSKGKQ